MTLSCGPPALEVPGGPRSREAVAVVSGQAIVGLDLRLPPGATDGVRRSALDTAILRALAVAEARRRGLAERADVAEKLAAIEREAKAREEALLRDALLEDLRDELAPSEEQLRAHYEATRIRYAARQLRVLRHPFPSRDAAEQALAQGEIAAEGAEILGPAPLAKLPRTVLPEALRLDRPGARSVAGSEEEGWSVIELAEVLRAEPRPFEDVRGEVERSLRTIEAEKAFRALLGELRAKAEVEIDEAALARVAPAREAPPASLR